jgi:hypothetical protein
MNGKVVLVVVHFYCGHVTSSFSTTCIRVPNLNPGSLPIQVAARSKRGFATPPPLDGIVGSNPAGDVDACLL